MTSPFRDDRHRGACQLKHPFELASFNPRFSLPCRSIHGTARGRPLLPNCLLTNPGRRWRIIAVHFPPRQGSPVTALLTTNLGATPLLGRGKVRDLYAVGDALLLVATDRISAFDHVLATGIPGKGRILTQISLFWFDFLSELVANHLIAADVREFPASLQPYADQLEGRSMLVKRAAMFPVECVARSEERRVGKECRSRSPP